MTYHQETVFMTGEGDAWYRRNRTHVGPADLLVRLISRVSGRERMQRVCELGCANGWRLALLRSYFASNSVFAGIDASGDAIAEGRKQFPDLDLRQSALSQVPHDEPFDLVIVNFVLHWIDRDLLSRCIGEIDRLVKWDGYLFVGDFLPDFPMRRHYHHLPGQEVYTYKQDYAQAFLGLSFYKELNRVTYSHAHRQSGLDGAISPVEGNDRAFISVLHKTPRAYPNS
jgi:trans-aconitate methyltransferase